MHPAFPRKRVFYIMSDNNSENPYDYIIVGGGSAGCVLANRLSADPTHRVLMLEAGRPDYFWDLFIHMPAALTIPIGSKYYDWMYQSDPEPHMGGRRVYHARGKVLGGSSSINGMIFQRGNPRDYEKWGRLPGLERWDYAHCLPYFKRMESCMAEIDSAAAGNSAANSEQSSRDAAFRGTEGPLHLERGPGVNPLFPAFLKATEEAGYQRTNDVNGYRQEGFALFDRNVRRGRRWSAARAYYHPAKKRRNLELRSRVLTSRILFEARSEDPNLSRDLNPGARTAPRAIGVEYIKGGRKHQVFGNEIILCAGAFNSPQLLQLSGVGDAGHLRKVGVDVVHDLKGVGENLMDHLEVYIQYSCKKPVSMNPAMKWWRKPFIGLQWLFRGGPAATNHFEAGGFIKSNPKEAYPNLMFHFLPLAVRYDGSSPEGGHGYQVHVGPMFSDARGRVRIRSKDPREHPEIRFNYLSTEQDRREWSEAVRRAREILNQPAMKRFNGGEISPGPGVATDAEILEWVARDAETALHPSGTCRMGVDEKSVVHPDTLKVHGVEGLRVVDASVMPIITNGNIYAPVVMIAEKAADLILNRPPLPPERLEYH
ncbi:MAG: choline dehydrogenase [Leptospirales bacterium]